MRVFTKIWIFIKNSLIIQIVADQNYIQDATILLFYYRIHKIEKRV